MIYIPTNPARCLSQDLKKAGILKHIKGEGKLDFHSFRVTYLTKLDEVGASVKQAQVLARHSNPDITYNKYIKTDELNLKNVIEKLYFVCSQSANNENAYNDINSKVVQIS